MKELYLRCVQKDREHMGLLRNAMLKEILPYFRKTKDLNEEEEQRRSQGSISRSPKKS